MFFNKYKRIRRQRCHSCRTLCDLKTGEKAVVSGLLRSETCPPGRLAAMGITPGTEIIMLANDTGMLRILVRSCRISLCQSMGESVLLR